MANGSHEHQSDTSGERETFFANQFGNPGEISSASEAESEGLLKTARACLKAKQFGVSSPKAIQDKVDLEYIWMDTCCINKQDAQEFEEAINSMFRWYRDARVCYAYLPDVSVVPNDYQKLEKLRTKER